LGAKQFAVDRSPFAVADNRPDRRTGKQVAEPRPNGERRTANRELRRRRVALGDARSIAHLAADR
jgi:hypothetical protein